MKTLTEKIIHKQTTRFIQIETDQGIILDIQITNDSEDGMTWDMDLIEHQMAYDAMTDEQKDAINEYIENL